MYQCNALGSGRAGRWMEMLIRRPEDHPPGLLTRRGPQDPDPVYRRNKEAKSSTRRMPKGLSSGQALARNGVTIKRPYRSNVMNDEASRMTIKVPTEIGPDRFLQHVGDVTARDGDVMFKSTPT
jgi:hypothetical protein